jgi:hypothetical protein
MFIDLNQKIYLKYVKKIIIKSCSFLKLLKIVDIINRHSCFLMNFQNIDYQSFDLLEKFVDFTLYFRNFFSYFDRIVMCFMFENTCVSWYDNFERHFFDFNWRINLFLYILFFVEFLIFHVSSKKNCRYVWA